MSFSRIALFYCRSRPPTVTSVLIALTLEDGTGPAGWAVLLLTRVAAGNQGELSAEVTNNGRSSIASFLWLCRAKIMIRTFKKRETLRTLMSIESCTYDMNTSVVSNKPTLAPLSAYLLFSHRKNSFTAAFPRAQANVRAPLMSVQQTWCQHLAEKKGMRNQSSCGRITHA